MFTKKFCLKFLEIKKSKSTENMEELFTECFLKNKSILENQSFFTIYNGIEEARFAREGCNSDQRGIYIFLNYLVRTIRRWKMMGSHSILLKNQ